MGFTVKQNLDLIIEYPLVSLMCVCVTLCVHLPGKVDNNVTRHIDEELERSDWDVMVLHYLGLDHIGHVEGPHSLLVQPKLSEMDRIVEHVLDSLRLQVLK